MKGIFFFCLIIVLAGYHSCSKNKQTAIDNYVDIQFKDATGNDLLNPQTGFYKTSDISIYYVDKNNDPILFNKPNLAASHGYTLYKDDIFAKSYLLRVYPSDLILDLDGVKKSKTILKIGNNISDTVICEYSIEPNYLAITKLWYNGQLKYPNPVDIKDGRGRIIQIVK